MSTGRSEDEAWASIVANYGERAEIDQEPPAAPPRTRPVEPEPVAHADEVDEPEERFVPPVPAPAPRLPAAKRAAWLGVVGSPVVLIVAMLFSLYVPRLLGYALVAGFVGGFVYLVATMPRREDRDPWDDGAQI